MGRTKENPHIKTLSPHNHWVRSHVVSTSRVATRERTFIDILRKGRPMATTGKRAPNPAFMKAMTPSPALAAVVGSTPLPRTEVTKRMWDYIKQHNLQDPANKRNINADAKLKPIFGKDQVTMFEMTKLVNQHLS
jgi:upstream activation factor subunit UAF30